MTRRRFVISLPGEEYRRLVERAVADDRPADQEASYLLKKLLQEAASTTPKAPADAAR